MRDKKDIDDMKDKLLEKHRNKVEELQKWGEEFEKRYEIALQNKDFNELIRLNGENLVYGIPISLEVSYINTQINTLFWVSYPEEIYKLKFAEMNERSKEILKKTHKLMMKVRKGYENVIKIIKEKKE